MKSAAKASIVVTLVFMVGFLSGVGAVSLFTALRSDSREESARIVFQGRRAAQPYSSRIERLTDELNLSAEQREQFEPILLAGMEKIRQLRGQHRPAVREVLLETRTALRAILDESQTRRFDEISPLLNTEAGYRRLGRCLDDTSQKPFRRGGGRERRSDSHRQRERRNFR
jgi:hypothetical protein